MVEQKKDIQKKAITPSERFTNLVLREFQSLVGAGIEFDAEKKRLAQHLFIKADATLRELDLKRKQGNPPITWENVNLQKFSVDAVARIELGLDALIENHLHLIPYLNARTKKYDVSQQVGYIGKDYYRREHAIETPVNIIYQLVHETDTFTPIYKDKDNPVETYVFKVEKPFARGKVIGGFGYIEYTNSSKNQLVIVSEEMFLKSEKKAQSNAFWGPYPEEMRLKTLVNRVTSHLRIDPKKVSQSYFKVEREEKIAEGEIEAEVEEIVEDVQEVEPEPEQKQEEKQQEEKADPEQSQQREPGDDQEEDQENPY